MIKDEIASLECGHIHLNQQMDLDHEVGIKIGTNVYQALVKKQQIPPLLTPMIDDEHVLTIQLSPKEYRDFSKKIVRKMIHLLSSSQNQVLLFALLLLHYLHDLKNYPLIKL